MWNLLLKILERPGPVKTGHICTNFKICIFAKNDLHTCKNIPTKFLSFIPLFPSIDFLQNQHLINKASKHELYMILLFTEYTSWNKLVTNHWQIVIKNYQLMGNYPEVLIVFRWKRNVVIGSSCSLNNWRDTAGMS